MLLAYINIVCEIQFVVVLDGSDVRWQWTCMILNVFLCFINSENQRARVTPFWG